MMLKKTFLNLNLLSKVYFSQLIVQASDDFTSCIDFIIMGLTGRSFIFPTVNAK